MRHVICIEASHQRGMGHLFRGVTLATGLAERNHEVQLVVNRDDVALAWIKQTSFTPLIVESYTSETAWEEAVIERVRPDWWINDRLHTSQLHAERVLRHQVRLATIDDLGEGARLATCRFLPMVLDPVNQHINEYYGPRYAILNPGVGKDFALPRSPGAAPKVLISLGGSDTYGVTPRVLSALGRVISRGLQVVLGPAFIHNDALHLSLEEIGCAVKVHHHPHELIPLLAQADLVVCGGGVTLFEAAALGKPTVVIANEPHEVPIAGAFETRGACLYAGFHQDGFEERLVEAVTLLLANESLRSQIAQRARALVDGQGLRRIMELIERVA